MGKAVDHFEKARRRGDAYSCAYPGELHYYGRGDGVEQSTTKALALFEEVRSQGLAEASCFLGTCLQTA